MTDHGILFGGARREPMGFDCEREYPPEVCDFAENIKQLLMEKFMRGRQEHGDDMGDKDELDLAYETRAELLDGLCYIQTQIEKMEAALRDPKTEIQRLEDRIEVLKSKVRARGIPPESYGGTI